MTDFVPFDQSVFKPGTYGAMGLCGYCKKRPAEFMKSQRAGPKRTQIWYPFCDLCRRKILGDIQHALAKQR